MKKFRSLHLPYEKDKNHSPNSIIIAGSPGLHLPYEKEIKIVIKKTAGLHLVVFSGLILFIN